MNPTPLRTALLATALTIFFSSAAGAIEFRKSQAFSIAEGHEISEELWLWSGPVSIAGAVREPLLARATTFEITGNLEEELWILADSIQYGAHSSDRARLVAGQSITIGGSIDRGLIAAGSTVMIETNTVIGDYAVIAGETVLLDGRIEGDAFIAGKRVTLSGDISGSLRVIAEEVVFLPGSRIGGDLVYSMQKDLVAGSNVSIGGETRRAPFSLFAPVSTSDALLGVVILKGYFFFAALAVGIPFLFIFPGLIGRSAQAVRQTPGRCLLKGGMYLCAIPVLAVLAFITQIGIFLSAILSMVYFIGIYLSKFAVALVLGGLVLKKRGAQGFGSAFLTLCLGLLLLYFITSLPILGMGLWLATVLLGMGGLVLALRSAKPRAPVPPDLPPAPGASRDEFEKVNEQHKVDNQPPDQGEQS